MRITKSFVQAIGRESRPTCPVTVNTGRMATVIASIKVSTSTVALSAIAIPPKPLIVEPANRVVTLARLLHQRLRSLHLVGPTAIQPGQAELDHRTNVVQVRSHAKRSGWRRSFDAELQRSSG